MTVGGLCRSLRVAQMTRIKICGITNVEDAEAAVALGADALGFVFAESPRWIEPQAAGAIVRALPPFVAAVAVVVDEPIEDLRQMLEASGCGAVQLHGKEPPDYLEQLDPWRTIKLSRWRVIKAFRVREVGDLRRLSRYKRADAFLLDSHVPGKAGGTGIAFDWGVAREAAAFCKADAADKPIILAGGLNPDNVTAALEAARPYAVDVSTGVEAAPGRKDFKLMRDFVRAVREFDASQG